MTNERLKEIKDSIDFQLICSKAKEYDTEFIYEELELYNEVIRLREIIDKTIEITENLLKTEDKGYYQILFQEQLDILKENNNESN